MTMDLGGHVAEASRLLLKRGFDSATVTEALGMLGRGAAVDRVYIFENGGAPDAPTCSQRYEWSDQVEPQIDNPALQDLPYLEMAPGWSDVLSANEVICGLPATMAPEVRALLEAQGIQSILVCPIFLDERWWGFVGFDDCHAPRSWSETEIDLLRRFSRALAGAVKHADMKSRLALARDQLRSLAKT